MNLTRPILRHAACHVRSALATASQSMKKCFVPLACVGLLASLLGCGTTHYKPSGSSGGYRDERLGTNSFRVSFARNLYTKPEAAYNFLLHRCAELTVTNRCDYFVIQNYDDFELRRKYPMGMELDATILIQKGAMPVNTPGAFEAGPVLKRDAPHAKENRKIW